MEGILEWLNRNYGDWKPLISTMDGVKEKLRVEDWVRETEGRNAAGEACVYIRPISHPASSFTLSQTQEAFHTESGWCHHSPEDSPSKKRGVKEEIPQEC